MMLAMFLASGLGLIVFWQVLDLSSHTPNLSHATSPEALAPV